MKMNGCWDFEAQKSASIHHKKCPTRLRGVNKYILRQIDAFVWEKYPYLKLYNLDSIASANCCMCVQAYDIGVA